MVSRFPTDIRHIRRCAQTPAVRQGTLKGMGTPLLVKLWRIVRGLFLRGPG